MNNDKAIEVLSDMICSRYVNIDQVIALAKAIGVLSERMQQQQQPVERQVSASA